DVRVECALRPYQCAAVISPMEQAARTAAVEGHAGNRVRVLCRGETRRIHASQRERQGVRIYFVRALHTQDCAVAVRVARSIQVERDDSIATTQRYRVRSHLTRGAIVDRYRGAVRLGDEKNTCVDCRRVRGTVTLAAPGSHEDGDEDGCAASHHASLWRARTVR